MPRNKSGPANTDYAPIRHEYFWGYQSSGKRHSLSSVAQQFGVTLSAVQKKARSEDWHKGREAAWAEEAKKKDVAVIESRADAVARAEQMVVAQALRLLEITDGMTVAFVEEQREKRPVQAYEVKRVAEVIEKAQAIVIKSVHGEDPQGDSRIQAVLDGLADIRKRRMKEAEEDDG